MYIVHGMLYPGERMEKIGSDSIVDITFNACSDYT